MSGRSGRFWAVLVAEAALLASCGQGATPKPSPLPAAIDQTKVGETVTLETLFGTDWQIAWVASCSLDLLAVGQQRIDIGFMPCLDPEDNHGSSVGLFEADGTLVRWYRAGLRIERLIGCFRPGQQVTLGPNGFNPVNPTGDRINTLICDTVRER